MANYKIQREDIIREPEVAELINVMNNNMDKAMVAMMYLFGARPCELLAVKKEDFNITDDRIEVRFPTRKKRHKVQKLVMENRTLWCYKNDPFARVIIDYLLVLDPGEKMFEYGSTEKSANTIIGRKIKTHNKQICPYLFRHTRNTLIGENGGTESHLTVWNGWADGRPAKHYVERTKRLIDAVPSPKSKDVSQLPPNKLSGFP